MKRRLRRLINEFSFYIESVIEQLYIELLNGFRTSEPLPFGYIDDTFDLLFRVSVPRLEKIGVASMEFYKTDLKNSTYGLDALMRERTATFMQAMTTERYWFKVSAQTTIGRRNQDIIRELSLREIEKAFVKGAPTTLTRKNLIKRLQKRGLEVKPEDLKDFYTDMVKKVPLLHKDGTPKILLKIRPYEKNLFRAYDLKYYSELVALTTVDEARWSSQYQRAEKEGTKFVKFSSTGKDYKRLKDELCRRIDGQIFSLKAETKKGEVFGAYGASGKFYPWIKNVIEGDFLLPHPFCKHQPTPIPERFT